MLVKPPVVLAGMRWQERVEATIESERNVHAHMNKEDIMNMISLFK